MYEVGEKVRLKTWSRLVEDFGLDNNRNIIIRSGYRYNIESEKDITSKTVDRIVAISSTSPIFYDRHFEWYYVVNEDRKNRWWLLAELIDGLVEDYKRPYPINDRFEILDL